MLNNILVCDDDTAIVDSIEIYLQQEGYHVIKAYDGVQALEVLHKEEIQLVIIDVMMPRLDGIRAVSYTHLFFKKLIQTRVTLLFCVRAYLEYTRR